MLLWLSKAFIAIVLNVVIQNAATSQTLENAFETFEKNCPKSNKLVIKKAYIELLKEGNKACEKTFVKKLIESCEAKTCEDIWQLFQKTQKEKKNKNGTIIGE